MDNNYNNNNYYNWWMYVAIFALVIFDLTLGIEGSKLGLFLNQDQLALRRFKFAEK